MGLTLWVETCQLMGMCSNLLFEQRLEAWSTGIYLVIQVMNNQE